MRVKRDLSYLTQDHLRDIQEWLQIDPSEQHYKCPFKRTYIGECPNLCGRIFPKLITKSRLRNNNHPFDIVTIGSLCKCPCHAYKVSYVRWVARSILRDRGMDDFINHKGLRRSN